MKKELKVVAVVLVALIVFLCGFGLGASKGITIGLKVEGGAAQVAATVAPTPDTTAPVTAPPATDTTAAPVADTTAAPAGDTTAAPAGDTTAAPAGDAADTTAAPAGNAGVPSSKEEIVAKYNEVVNAAKKLQNGTLHKTSVTNVQVTDLPVPALKGTLDSIVQRLITPSDNTFEFVNGQTADGATPNGKITPGDREVALKPEGVATATATADGAGYKMTIVLAPEKSTYDGTNTVNPVHHESCLTPLNLATLDISPANITEADMSYSGATLELTVDGEGRLVSYKSTLPMEGTGKGGIGPISLTLGIAGEMVETFDFTY